jgi:hypothetical protein
VPIERLGESLTPSETEHLTGCARCQTELALWHEFDDSTPSSDEGAAVAWIVAAVKRGGAAAPSSVPVRAPWWRAWPRLAAAAATLAVAAAVGYGLWDSEPAVRRQRSEAPVYRTLRVQTIAPIGDVVAAPRLLQWAPLGGAAAYDVQILEVDRAVLWHGTTASTQVEIPAGVIAQLVAGKTVLWEISARDAAGAILAESGTQRVRVTAGAGNGRNP